MSERVKRKVSAAREKLREKSAAQAQRKRIGHEVLRWYKEQDEVEFSVVPHSHLDYAWYREREASKMREVEAFDKTFKVQSFTLEQMVTAEEFIEFAGHYVDKSGKSNEEKLREMVAEGRMEMVAMYGQPDIFLSPQSLRFWNYYLGEQVVKKLGGKVSNNEYLPDTFGGPDTTPTVIAHAGRNAIITFRGDDQNPPASTWKGPDDSKILRLLMQGGYANAAGLTDAPGYNRETTPPEVYFEKQVDHATEIIWRHIETYGKRYKDVALPHALLMNGNDFTNPDMDLPVVLEAVEKRIRQEIPNFRIKTNSLGAYVAKVFETLDLDKLPVFTGEMRSGKEHYVLRGIDSARMELKQRMHEVGNRAYEAGALISLLILARNSGLVENDHKTWQQVNAWWSAIEKIIITCSHDTISGCGDDRTYDLAKSLMTGAYGATDQAARNSIAALANRRDTYGPYQHKEHLQTFANTLAYDRTTIIEIPMQGELEHDGGLKAIVTHRDGREVAYPAQIIQKVDSRYVVCAVPIEGMSSVQVRLEPTEGKVFREYTPETSMFENDLYSIDIESNGTLNITNKRTGAVTRGLLFEDQGDRGDEYNFCPTDDDSVTTTADQPASVKVINDGDVFTELQIDTSMLVPEGLDGPEGTVRDGIAKRSSNMVSLPISTRVRFYKDPAIDRIEFATTIDNNARDHRLRVRFSTPNADNTVRAKEPFGLTARPAVPILGGKDWKEPLPVATSHNQGLITTGDFRLFNKGLAEYEAASGEDGKIESIALTLFRSVGYLSRGDLKTRPGWAGPGSATPEAQMIGKHTYEYAVSLSNNKQAGDAIAKMYDYMHRAEHGFHGAHINELLNIHTSLPLDRVEFMPLQDAQSFVATFANPNDEPATVTLNGKFSTALECDGLGNVQPNSSDMHRFEIPPRGMVSVRIS